MKKQVQKFQIGDVVTNARNNFRRIIRHAEHIKRNRMLVVLYYYSDEEVNDLFIPTGHFKESVTRACSQDHLLRWAAGR